MAAPHGCEFGMSENLGPLTLGKRNGPVFLGRDFHEERNYRKKSLRIIDVEIRNIVDSSYDHAVRLLTENREIMDRIVEVLLEKENDFRRRTGAPDERRTDCARHFADRTANAASRDARRQRAGKEIHANAKLQARLGRRVKQF